MSKQEIVSDGSLVITRAEVPGGWIYNSYDKGNKILGSCFVPNPARDAIFDEMLEALKGALRIKDLWEMTGEVSAEHKGEAEALGKMRQMFESVISKAEGNHG